MRKAMWLLCLAVSLIARVPVAAAAENLGSIQIKLEAGDLAVTNGAVTLYQVGVRTDVFPFPVNGGTGHGEYHGENEIHQRIQEESGIATVENKNGGGKYHRANGEEVPFESILGGEDEGRDGIYGRQTIQKHEIRKIVPLIPEKLRNQPGGIYCHKKN